MNIYQDIELERTSAKVVGKMIQDLLICNGKIVDMCCLTNSFSEDRVTYWTSFYRLSFHDLPSLMKFKSFGYTTEDVKTEAIELSIVSENLIKNQW